MPRFEAAQSGSKPGSLLTTGYCFSGKEEVRHGPCPPRTASWGKILSIDNTMKLGFGNYLNFRYIWSTPGFKIEVIILWRVRKKPDRNPYLWTGPCNVSDSSSGEEYLIHRGNSDSKVAESSSCSMESPRIVLHSRKVRQLKRDRLAWFSSSLKVWSV